MINWRRISIHTALVLPLIPLAVVAFLITTSGQAAQMHTSRSFMGPKANTGTVSHTRQGNRQVLTLSDDFVVPDTPDPHWQIVDSRGGVYLLDKLRVKGDKYNKSITLPTYIPDVAKVRIWCAWAEANLGEAEFASPVK